MHMNDISVIGNVKIETDENGNQHFTVLDKPVQSATDSRSWWQKVCDWWNAETIQPYVKVRDMSDPFNDQHCDGGTHKCIEGGIKISF